MSSAAALIDRFRNAPPTSPGEREERIAAQEIEEVWWRQDRGPPRARREPRSPMFAPPAPGRAAPRGGRGVSAREAALAAEDEALLRRELEYERRARASMESVGDGGCLVR